MRRGFCFIVAAGLGLAATAVAWRPGAAQNVDPAAKPAPAVHPLPIRQVVLFNSGVGYIQREGTVTGNAKIDLTFPANDINDLLKSLVLQDSGGGTVGAVSYDSYDPLEKILSGFAIDLSNNPTFGEILNQARGEKVEIQLVGIDKNAPTKIRGSIVGAEKKLVQARPEIDVTKEFLNVLGAETLQSVPLDQVVGVRFVNPVLEQEFQRALKTLASTHDLAKKAVTVHFNGQGPRSVRVGYVVERPIWKTTYRLRCDPNGKLSLQGWALVENTSDDDWNDVRMALVSGRPISFRMNLYEPLYIPRPLVEPELFSSLRPVTYGGTMPGYPGGGALGGRMLGGALGGAGGGAPGAGGPPTPAGEGAAVNGNQFGGSTGSFIGGGFSGGYNGSSGGLGGANPGNRATSVEQQRLSFEELQKRKKALDDALREGKDKGAAIAMNFKEGIQSVASAEEIGGYFQYVLDQKISLPRQKSAMLPIIDRTIDGAKVSIFNENVHIKHPLLGLRVKNTSGQPLTQGPVTVYDDATYAGDTRILDLQPNEERLLSYALDLGTEVKTQTTSSPGPEMTFKIGQTTISSVYKQIETKTYLIKNRSTHERTLIVEHPIRSSWNLTEPAKPAERTRDVYRFAVKVAAGATANLAVTEEEPRADLIEFRDGQPEYVVGAGITVKEVQVAYDHALQSVKVLKGVLTPTFKARETRSRFVQNLSQADREFQIDHIVRPEWFLLRAADAPLKGPAVWRSTLKIARGKAGQQTITEERIASEAGHLVRNLPEAKVREFLNSAVVSDKVKAGLTRHLELSRQSFDADKTLADLERQFKAASDDQNRLRQNLNVIPQTSEPYKKFLDKFVAQETEIEGLQRQIRAAEAAAAAARRGSETFLESWSAD
jgi:hypothetical protein